MYARSDPNQPYFGGITTQRPTATVYTHGPPTTDSTMSKPNADASSSNNDISSKIKTMVGRIKLTPRTINNYCKRLFAELFGTFILTWAHAGLALSLVNNTAGNGNKPDSRVDIAADAFGSGLTLVGLVYALGHISGAHLNPGVSLAFVVRGDMNPLSLLPYITAQIAGGFVAAAVLFAVFPNDPEHGSLGANAPAGGFTVLSAFWMEFIGSIFLQLAVVGTATRGKNVGGHAALAAGLTIGAMIAFLAPYGGGSMNPARSLGPAVLASSQAVLDVVWIYIAAPFGAALCNGLVLRWLAPKSKQGCEGDDPEAQLAKGTLGEDGVNTGTGGHTHNEDV